MDGGIHAIRGYLFQYLICVLDSFQEPWSSVIIEPSVGEDKVDILWLFKAEGRVYKKAVQVKSDQNQFGKPEAIKIACALKNSFKDADSYELVLIGHASSTLIEYLKEGEQEVKILAPKLFELEAFIAKAYHRIDKYLDENYATQLPGDQLDNLVYSLIAKLQFYTTNKREVTRDEFENILSGWVDPYVHHVDRELQESQDFRRLYGFDTSPNLRIAIDKFYNQSKKIRRSFFKECQNFLTTDKLYPRKLKVIYPHSEKIFLCFGVFFQLIASIPTIAFLILSVYLHWKFIFLFLVCFPLLLASTFFIRPYCLAKKIDRELQELYEIK